MAVRLLAGVPDGAWSGSPGAPLSHSQTRAHLQRQPRGFGQQSPLKGFPAVSSNRDGVIIAAQETPMSAGLRAPEQGPAVASGAFSFAVNGWKACEYFKFGH